MNFTFETFLILLLALLIIGSNVAVLLVLYKTEQLDFVNKYFFVSLTLADLFIGIFVVPFSFWTSMYDRWIYGDKFCHIEAYLACIFWIASLYSLMWLSIDHYVAIRKPDRYDSLMTRMRCICWVAFIWIAALSFCCPPLFGDSRAIYYKAAHICIIDWSMQKAYIITSGIMIIVPPIIALPFFNLYMFTGSYSRNRVVYEKSMDSSSRAEHYFISFVIGLVFLFSWLPWCILQLCLVFRSEQGAAETSAALHFYLMWFAIANSFWKFVVYVVLAHDFRVGIKIVYTKMTCQWTSVVAL